MLGKNKGRMFTKEQCEACSNRVKGRKHSEETKMKMRKKIISMETRQKLSEKRKHIIMTEETKKKIANTLTGRKRPELTGDNNPMHTHPNAYKSKWGKTGYRDDLGIFVKSTWEANIMQVFKFLGLNVKYEPKSFLLSNGKTYRPDFYILDTEEIIEVKGFFRDGNKSTINRFKKEYPGISFDLIDKQRYTEYCNEFKKYIPNWE